MSLRRLLWQLRHPFSSPPWMTEGDQERANRAWENLGSDFSVDPVLRELAGDALPTIGAGHGAAQDALELQEAPDDPAS